MTNPNRIELYYGYVETTYGIAHSFEVKDPEECADDEDIAKALAENLHTTRDNPAFNFDSMYLDIPQSVIERIKNNGKEDTPA